MFVPDLTRKLSVQKELQGPQAEAAAEFQTFGPTRNEVGTTYSKGGGAHRVVAFERVSPDIATGHMARVAAFYRRLDEAPVVAPTARSLKDKVLRAERPFRAPAPPPPLEAVPRSVVLATPAPAPAPSSGSPFGVSYFGVSGFGV